ncbi:hypothetical protein M0R04_06950 [Candidatus Dojkabacteria bacterium]|jgi:hypothetical protein|nr:hypothetical protein [Candidatus Dojkabacteria bacterium]
MLKLFTLNNGLEVIGKLTKETDNFYDIDQPLGIHTKQTGPDTYGLAFAPVSASNPEGEHRFFFNGITSESLTIPAEIEKAYLQYTSKIQIVGHL